MKEIIFKEGVVIVDDEDYDRVIKSHHQHAWFVSWANGVWYVIRSVYPGKKKEYLHHFIIGDTKLKDHINDNGLDNRKENLRYCTPSQNAMNRVMKPSQYTIYRGVTWHIAAKCWIAQICLNKKKKHLGCFPTDLEAAKAYNKAALELHGEFAVLNDL